ncbi:MAG: glycosyltransferase family 4 protein [Gaiellaceae bacterium]
MRIALVTHRTWPAIGGAETYVAQLAQELSAQHEVTVLAHRIDDGPSDRLTDSLRPPPPFEAFHDGAVLVKPLCIPAARRAALAPLVFQVVPVLRRHAYRSAVRRPTATFYAAVVGPLIAHALEGADIVHVFSGGLLGAASVRAARLLGAPVVATGFIHRRSWGDDPASAAVYRSADRVVAQLRTEADVFRELGVREEQIAICGSGTPGLAGGGGRALRERHAIVGPLIVFLAARRAGKGADLVLESAALLSRRIENVTVAFVGPGGALPERAAAARIIDVGPLRLEDPARAAWVDAADAVTLPSDAESFGIAVVEAWSLRKPVVVSDIPTLRELVEEAEGGLAVPRTPAAIADALERLLGDRTLHGLMAENGYRAWRERYTTTHVAAAHEALYTSLVEMYEDPT